MRHNIYIYTRIYHISILCFFSGYHMSFLWALGLGIFRGIESKDVTREINKRTPLNCYLRLRIRKPHSKEQSRVKLCRPTC